LSRSKRLTLSLPLFGILTMLAVSTVAAQPRPPAPVAGETTGQASAPPPQSTSRGENFSANKTPAQLFASDCTGAGCHKGAGGLAKNSSSLGLTGFLREHYTNSRESASALAAYLMGAGAGPAERPGRGEPATPRPPRAASRTPAAAGEEAKPEEGQGPLTPARPRRQPSGAPAAAGTPAGETPAEIVRPEPGAKPAPAAAQRTQRGRQHQTTAVPPSPPPEAAPAPPPPPPPPPPVVHDIFD